MSVADGGEGRKKTCIRVRSLLLLRFCIYPLGGWFCAFITHTLTYSLFKLTHLGEREN